jgi:RAS protein activator-like 2
MRHSRSHECLSPTIQQQHLQSILTSDQILFIDNSFESQQNDENQIKFTLTNDDLKQINSLHSSILNQENCFEIKNNQNKRYFLCRSTDERDKWLYILKYLLNSNYNYERRFENTMQLWILEAKGGCISSSSNKIKKFFCEILLNNVLYGRTCIKEKKDLLFWGENFNFK